MSARSHSAVFANRMYLVVVHEIGLSYVRRAWRRCKEKDGTIISIIHMQFEYFGISKQKMSLPADATIFFVILCDKLRTTHSFLFGSFFLLNRRSAREHKSHSNFHKCVARAKNSPTADTLGPCIACETGEWWKKESRVARIVKKFIRKMEKHSAMPHETCVHVLGNECVEYYFLMPEQSKSAEWGMRHIVEMCGCRMKGTEM